MNMDSEEKNIFELIAGLRVEYSKLLLGALEEGLQAIGEIKESGGYIGTYYDFPNLSFKDNGLPSLSSSIGGGPTEYISCFSSFGRKPLINEDEIGSFEKLVKFARANESLHKRFNVERNPNVKTEIKIEIDKISITSGIKDSLERYIHTFNSFVYEEQNALIATKPTLAYIFDEKLGIDIHIPILFLNFPFDEYQIADGIYIEKISKEHHLSRYKVKSYNTSAHESVIYCATHALVLKGWYVHNTERMWDFDILSKSRAYPLDLINNFFGALRIWCSEDTGYAQVYAVAKEWTVHSTTNLPYVQGVTVRSYPGWFEDYYWNIEDIPIVTEDATSRIMKFFNLIASAKENSITLSLKRLNRCLIRDDEEDAVLDATIALEALLSDDGNQEMTHKLAMRMGALSRLDETLDRTPEQAFRDVKGIYGYRSAIVHGSKNLDKKRIIKIDENKNTTAHLLAIDYVKMVLRVLLENEKYRDPKQIDSQLLLGSHDNA